MKHSTKLASTLGAAAVLAGSLLIPSKASAWAYSCYLTVRPCTIGQYYACSPAYGWGYFGQVIVPYNPTRYFIAAQAQGSARTDVYGYDSNLNYVCYASDATSGSDYDFHWCGNKPPKYMSMDQYWN